MKIKNFGLMLLLAFAGAALIAGCGDKKVPKGSVAVAGDVDITKPEFRHWYVIAARSQQPPPAKGKKQKPVKIPEIQSQQGKQLKDQVMQFLINAAWIRQQAEEEDITVTDAQVKKEFAKTKKQFFKKESDYNKFLKNSGMSQKDVLTRVELQLRSNKIREKITKEKGNVSDEDIDKYYKKNKKQFETPETREVSIVQTKKKGRAEEALKALKSGESFKAVASQYSQDQATKKTGETTVSKGQFGTDFDKEVFKAKTGKLIGPFKTQFGYYIVKVKKSTPKKTTPLKKAKPQIKNILKGQNQQKSLEKFIKDFRKKWKDQTVCLKAYSTQDCKNAPKPKKTTPTAPQGAPPGAGGSAPPPTSGKK